MSQVAKQMAKDQQALSDAMELIKHQLKNYFAMKEAVRVLRTALLEHVAESIVDGLLLQPLVEVLGEEEFRALVEQTNEDAGQTNEVPSPSNTMVPGVGMSDFLGVLSKFHSVCTELREEMEQQPLESWRVKKSQVARKTSEDLGLGFQDQHLTSPEANDLIGLPRKQESENDRG